MNDEYEVVPKDIDHRHLLWKYINHVGGIEGYTFIQTENDPSGHYLGEEFNEAEIKEMLLIDSMKEYNGKS